MKKFVALFISSAFLFNVSCNLFSGLITKNYPQVAEAPPEKLDLSEYLNETLLLAQTVIKASHEMGSELNAKALAAETKIKANNYHTSSDVAVKDEALAALLAVDEVKKQFSVIDASFNAVNQKSGVGDLKALNLKEATQKAVAKLVKHASIAEVKSQVAEAVAKTGSSSGSRSSLQAAKDATLVAKNSADAAATSAENAVTQAVLDLKSSLDTTISAAATAAETALNTAKVEQGKASTANATAQATDDLTIATTQKTAAQTAAAAAQAQAITAVSKAKEALTLNSMGDVAADRQAIDAAIASVSGKASNLKRNVGRITASPQHKSLMANNNVASVIKNFIANKASNAETRLSILAEEARRQEDFMIAAKAAADVPTATTAEVATQKAIVLGVKAYLLDTEKAFNNLTPYIPYDQYCFLTPCASPHSSKTTWTSVDGSLNSITIYPDTRTPNAMSFSSHQKSITRVYLSTMTSRFVEQSAGGASTPLDYYLITNNHILSESGILFEKN